MTHESWARLVGQRVALGGRDGPFRLCPTCGACEGRIANAPRPHAAGLYCTGCSSPISFLSQSHMEALDAAMPARRRA